MLPLLVAGQVKRLKECGVADTRIESITLTELEAAFLHVCGGIPDREVATPLNKSGAKTTTVSLLPCLEVAMPGRRFLVS